MHSIISETNGWELEVIADGGPKPYASPESVPPPGSLDGCSHLVLTRKSDPDAFSKYIAGIRLEERQRNTYVGVEAIVLREAIVGRSDCNPTPENTEKDVLYFRHRIFDGEGAKDRAARYSHACKREIDRLFFS
jgi:hypothetical protein